MNSLLLRGGTGFPRNGSLASFSHYKDQEAHNSQASVSGNGQLLEYETLELRVHPPNIEIDNITDDLRTVITVDSANRPGTLVEVVQHFTELGLDVKSARISSDGGWFVDVFEVVEANGGKVVDGTKLESIKQMLSVRFRGDDDPVANADETDDTHRVETTVFELAGEDAPGLLADVTQLLTTNGCDVRSAGVWTHNERVAFVVSVTEKGAPVQNGLKLERLRQLLLTMMDKHGDGIVNIKKVRGEVHHDRRLHQLLMAEESKGWLEQKSWNGTHSPCDSAGSVHAEYSQDINIKAGKQSDTADWRSPKHSKPEVDIQPCAHNGYWLVTIKCKDRSKLLFDTACTLADMDVDVYHATIDSYGADAVQEYYIKPRYGGCNFSAAKAAKLKYMLESAIQRRFPKGLKVHVHSVDRFGCLAALTRTLKGAHLSITRAKVKTYAVNNSSGHTFYVMGAAGGAPDYATVEAACSQIGGRLVEAGDEERALSTSGGDLRFSFSFLNRTWHKGWNGMERGSEGTSPSSSNGST